MVGSGPFNDKYFLSLKTFRENSIEMISFSISYWPEKQIQWTVIIRGDGCNSVRFRMNRSQSEVVIVQRPVAVWNLSQLQPIQSTLMNTIIETTEISNKAARTKQFLSISVTDGRNYFRSLSCRRLHVTSRTMDVLQYLWFSIRLKRIIHTF